MNFYLYFEMKTFDILEETLAEKQTKTQNIQTFQVVVMKSFINLRMLKSTIRHSEPFGLAKAFL